MTDYSNMSDFEINKAVAIALGAKQVDFYENGDRCAIYYELGGEGLTVRRGQALLNEQFNPCIDPADAWPIIVANRIGVIPAPSDGLWRAAHRDVGADGTTHYFNQCANPLRAAMIVFLMMKETEQCSS